MSDNIRCFHDLSKEEKKQFTIYYERLKVLRELSDIDISTFEKFEHMDIDDFKKKIILDISNAEEGLKKISGK